MSKEGIAVNAEHLLRILPEYWPFLLVVGGIITFFGYYLIKASLAAIAFLTGMYAGQVLWEFIVTHGKWVQFFNNVSGNSLQSAHVLVIFVVAISMTITVVTFYRFAAFLAGFLAGGITFSYFYMWIVKLFNVHIAIGNNTQIISTAVFIVFGIMVGIATLKSERKAIGTVLGILGALVTSYALMVALSAAWKISKEQVLNVLISGKNSQMLGVFIVVFLSLSVLSILFNSHKSRKDEKFESKNYR